MKKIILICLILIPFWGYSQDTQIKNIELEIKDNDVIINYNLVNKQTLTNNVDLILMDNSKNIYIPESISGNIGSDLTEGKNSLRFNMIDQDFPLDRELKPTLILDRNIKNGPNASLLSLLVPGLGDYFVEKPKNMIIKPYYRTIAVGGLLALAYIADGKKQDPKIYEKTVWVEDTYVHWQLVPAHFETIEITEKAKDYWLFKNDKELFIGAAASIWLFDIFWVMNKGQQNHKIKKALKNKNYDFSLSSNGFSCKINLK